MAKINVHKLSKDPTFGSLITDDEYASHMGFIYIVKIAGCVYVGKKSLTKECRKYPKRHPELVRWRNYQTSSRNVHALIDAGYIAQYCILELVKGSGAMLRCREQYWIMKSWHDLRDKSRSLNIADSYGHHRNALPMFKGILPVPIKVNYLIKLKLKA